MKIAIIGNTTHPLREPFFRGIERFTHSLVRKLIENGHEVVLFAKAGDLPCETRPILTEEENQTLSRLKKRQQSNAQKILRLKNHGYLRAMKEISKRKFDIVHNNSLDTLPLLAAERLNSVMLTTLHAPPSSEHIYMFKSLERQTSSYFCATTHFTKKAWKKTVGELDIAVVHNGALDLKDEITLNLHQRNDCALWVGSIEPKKGLHLALKACHLAGINLRFAGTVENQEYFEETIAPMMGNQDRYLGHLDLENLKKEMEAARVGLATPMMAEPFGLALIEMLSCGLPIVAFDKGAMGEIINQTNGCMVACEPEAIAAGIGKVKDLCKVKIQQQTIKKWSLDTMVLKYERIYNFLKALHEKDRKEKAYWYLYSSSRQGTLA